MKSDGLIRLVDAETREALRIGTKYRHPTAIRRNEGIGSATSLETIIITKSGVYKTRGSPAHKDFLGEIVRRFSQIRI